MCWHCQACISGYWRYSDLLLIRCACSFGQIPDRCPDCTVVVGFCFSVRTQCFSGTCCDDVLSLCGSFLFPGGRFSGFLSLSLAAFLMLLYRPFYLFDVSFSCLFWQYGEYCCFILYSQAGCGRLRRIRWLWNTLSVSMAAHWGHFPLFCSISVPFPHTFCWPIYW